MKPLRLIIITGLSGSGKSTAARALEDEGFFLVDNLPAVLLPGLLDLSRQSRLDNSDIAVVLDIRNRDFLEGCEPVFKVLSQKGHKIEIFFFDATDEVLLRRYSETRRCHPLSKTIGVLDAIALERKMLSGLRQAATMVTDTSELSPHQLRARVVQVVRGEKEAGKVSVLLQSFGFRYGLPAGSDLVMDVRFLPNPYFVPELRAFSGLDQAVRDYVLSDPLCKSFLDHLQKLFHFLLPQYQKEGKTYLTISIGCTGGRHRSVSVVERLRPWIAGEGMTVKVLHRDVEKV